MKKPMKAGVLVMLLLLAACAGASDEPISEESGNSQAAATDAQAATEAPDDGTVAETDTSGTGEEPTPADAGTAAEGEAPDLGVDEIAIGVTMPLSGPIGFIGEAIVNSIQLEVDAVNASGELGDTQLVIVTRDDELNPQLAVQNVREFASMDNIGLEIGSILSFMVEAIKPVVTENELVSCQPVVEVSNALEGAPTMFRNQDPDQFRVPRLIEHLAGEDIETIGLVYEDDPAGQSIDAQLQEVVPEQGMEYLGAQFFQIDDVSHVAQVERLAEADAIFVTANSANAGITARAAEEIGYEGLLVGTSGLHGFTYPAAGGDSILGTTFVANDLSVYTDIPEEEWAPAYRDHVNTIIEENGTFDEVEGYGQILGSPLGADCIRLYVEAVKAAGEYQGLPVVEAWEQLEVPREEMPSGVHAVFGPDDHEAFAPEDLWIYQWTRLEDGSYGLEVVDPAPNAE